jgi:hypothetical protein
MSGRRRHFARFTGRHSRMVCGMHRPSEDAVSIEATYAMRASFAASGFSPAALKFFDALVAVLTGGARMALVFRTLDATKWRASQR